MAHITPVALSRSVIGNGRERRSARIFWAACIAPTVLLLLGLVAYPLAYSLWTSFTNARVGSAGQFVGLSNYIKLISDPNMVASIAITLVYTAIGLTIQVTLGLLLALWLEKVTIGRTFLRTIIIIPTVLTPVIVGLQWKLMLDYTFGIANYLLSVVHLPPVGWLITPVPAVASLLALDAWQNTGFCMLVLSAGLAAAPREVFEAARVDGARWMSQLLRITIPLLRPALFLVVLWRMFGLLRTFDIVYGLTGGGPGHATNLLSFYAYTSMFVNFEPGYASAAAYILFAISLLVCLALVMFIDVDERVG